MITAGARFVVWLTQFALDAREPVANWIMGWLSGGLDKFTRDREPELIKINREHLSKLRETPGLPDELKNIIDASLETGDIGTVVLGYILNAFGAVLGLLSVGVPMGKVWGYLADRQAKSARFDPATAFAIWRRDPDKYALWKDDILDGGWSPEQIEAWELITQHYPSPQDLVRFQAREVFEPEMIARYGLDDEFGGIDLEPFRKAGMTDEVTLYYWRAHWEHASWNQVVEMLHRGQLTEDQVRDWFRLVEIPPFWRDKLIATSWNVPTRVDVRRFYDLKTIDESRLREIYTAMGYHDKDLDDYVLWTKIYVELPDLIARWKNGWISLDDARRRLVELGMTEASAEELIQTKVKSEESVTDTESKALTKTEIYKGVKQGKITRAEGIILLEELEFSRERAEYLLAINIPEDEEDEVVEERKLAKSDIKTALAEGIITEAEARVKLAELRYSAANIDLLIKIFRAAIKPPEEEKARQASKADIVEGVKKGVITAEEGYLMLIDIGFSADAANFILTVKAEESPFSPINYSEFKDLLTKYRRAAGMETVPVPEELKTAADELVKIKLEVEALERSVKEEETQITDIETAPDAATAKLKQLQVALNRARAELQRVQLKYNSLVAQWKHGAA